MCPERLLFGQVDARRTMKNTSKKRLLGILGAITALILVVSACGGGSATSTPTIPQELRANLGGEPNSLDPQMASTLGEFSVIRQVFQGLLGFGPELTLKPVVATQVPSVANGGISEDGLIYTFTLRDDVTWSDGQAVTAGDFEFAIKRLLAPETASRNAQIYWVIQGAPAFGMAQGSGDDVGVEAVDDQTLRITLAGPNPTFLQKMVLVHVFPVREDLIAQFGVGWTEAGNYIGNGPFVMTEWVHQTTSPWKPTPPIGAPGRAWIRSH